ncbi:MAG: amidohydrolase [Sulfolobus sp.]
MEVHNNTYTLTRCKFIVNPNGEILTNKNIVIQNGVIKDVGDEIEGDEVDCRKYIVLPGLVNAHTHSPMVVLRGYYDDAELNEWLSKMWEFERNMSKDLMKLGSEISILEMLSQGTTAFIDMYFNPEDVKELSEKYKIRAFAGYTFLDELFDAYEIDNLQRALRESEYFKPIVNVHSLYANSIKTILLAKQLAEERKTWIHIHVSETRKELYEIKRRTGLFPVEYMNSIGLLNENTQLVHLGWVASWEIELIKKANSKVTYCPTSNMKLATGGAFPLEDMIKNEITVTIGTDGAASNNSLDLFREMKNGVLLQRQMYWNTRVKALDLLRLATINGYKLIGIKGGEIKPNNVADLVLINSELVYPLYKERLISHIVYYITSEYVEKTIVNGVINDKIRLRDILREKVKRLYDMLNS